MCGIQKCQVGERPYGYVTNLSSWRRDGEMIPHRQGKISFIPSFCPFLDSLSVCLVFLSFFLSYPLPFFVSSSVFLFSLPWWICSSLQHSSDCRCCHPSHYISQIAKQLIIMPCFLHRGVAMGRGRVLRPPQAAVQAAATCSSVLIY